MGTMFVHGPSSPGRPTEFVGPNQSCPDTIHTRTMKPQDRLCNSNHSGFRIHSVWQGVPKERLHSGFQRSAHNDSEFARFGNASPSLPTFSPLACARGLLILNAPGRLSQTPSFLFHTVGMFLSVGVHTNCIVLRHFYSRPLLFLVKPRSLQPVSLSWYHHRHWNIATENLHAGRASTINTAFLHQS